MISVRVLSGCVLLAAVLLLGSLALQAERENPEWRIWTSAEGARIEAYLKQVLPDAIVIVRRDGQEFTAPMDRFSPDDHAYVTEWLRNQLPSLENFRALDFSEVDLAQSHDIDGVPHVRARGGEPRELAAVKMVLDFHQLSYDESLTERVRVRQGRREQAIPAPDLANALRSLPLATEVIRGRSTRENAQEVLSALNAIRKAISLDLPVLVAYRPLIEEDTDEVVVVATGYDRRNLRALDPGGGRQTARLDLRDLEASLLYALVIFPQFEPPAISATATEQAGSTISNEFLSRISAAIREAPEYEPVALTTFFQEKGIAATRQDINRTDLRGQLGRTRSFARQGGLPEIEGALERGSVVVVPQEFDSGEGFALIYGRAEGEFSAVEFFPDRTFRRGTLSRGDLANRWLTREDRTYRLDLIQIEASAAPHQVQPRQAPPPPPRQDPPGRPPAPPRQ